MSNNDCCNIPQVYDVRSCAFTDLNNAEFDTCISIIKNGGAVNPESAKAEIPHSKILVVARKENQIVGVGVIKQIRQKYTSGVAESSGAALPSDTPELGYIAVSSSHQRKGISRRIVEELLTNYEGPLFATTSNDNMKKVLLGSRFKEVGHKWEGQSGKLSLWVRE